MNEEKQTEIKEMAKDLGIAFQLAGTTRFGEVAEVLVNAGYRKTSDIARKIIFDIEMKLHQKIPNKNLIVMNPRACGNSFDFGRETALRDALDILNEIEKKYTESEKDNGN